MDNNLHETPVARDSRQGIAEAFWSPQLSGRGGYQAFETSPYFEYYSEQVKAVALAHSGRLPIKTHKDVADMVADMLNDDDRQTVRQKLADRLGFAMPLDEPAAELLDGSLDLAVRLLTMLDAGAFPRTYTGRETRHWRIGSLRDFLEETFQEAKTLSYGDGNLESAFTARNLDLVAGMRVELTTNLADHLRFREEGRQKTIMIFHHASFLKNQASGLFPLGFIDETLKTLALLFPSWDSSTKRWYRKQVEERELDEAVLHCGHVTRNLSDYDFWHDRLVELKRRFDEPQKASLKGLWNDRREGLAWTTLWVAIGCTVFFGLVQSIEGALQVYKAFDSGEGKHR